MSDSGRIWLYVALTVYLLILLGVSIYASYHVKTEQDFLVAGRQLPLHLSWGALMATWFGSSAIIAATNFSRQSGLSGVILDPFACSATLLFTGVFFARPLWKLQLFTMADFYRKKYGPNAELMACIIQVPTFFCWVASQYVALAAIAQAYFPVGKLEAVIISAIIITTYTLIGGMWSVTLTDALQIVVALIGLVALGYSVFSSIGQGSVIGGLSHVIQNTSRERLSFVPDWSGYTLMLAIGTFLTGLLGNVPGQDLQQRIFASKSATVASLSCILSSVLYFAFGLIPVMLGLAAFNMGITPPAGDKDGNMLLPLLASKFLNEAMVVVFVLAIISIVVSVATSATISQATILASNVLGRISFFRGHHLVLDRLCVIIVTIGSVLVAFSGESIMQLLDIQLSLAMVTLFVPLLMGIFFSRAGELAGYLPMICGALAWWSRYAFEKFYITSSTLELHSQYPGHVHQTVTAGGYPGFVADAAQLFALIPADILGLAISFIAYFVGRALSKPILVEPTITAQEPTA